MNERTHEQTFHLQCNSSINEIEYLEINPNFLSMYGVFTSPNTSQVRPEMSIGIYRHVYSDPRHVKKVQ